MSTTCIINSHSSCLKRLSFGVEDILFCLISVVLGSHRPGWLSSWTCHSGLLSELFSEFPLNMSSNMRLFCTLEPFPLRQMSTKHITPERTQAASFLNKKAVLSQRLPCDACNHTVQQYVHSLLLESPFVPSSTDCWAVRAKIRQKRPSRWL